MKNKTYWNPFNQGRMAAALLIFLLSVMAAACGLPTGVGDDITSDSTDDDENPGGTSTPPAVLDVSFSDQRGAYTNSFTDPQTETPLFFTEIYCYATDADSVSIQFGNEDGLMDEVFEMTYDTEDLRWEYLVRDEDDIPVVNTDGLYIECTATAGDQTASSGDDDSESNTLRVTLSDLPPIVRDITYRPKQNTLNYVGCDIRFAESAQVRIYELVRDFALSPSTVSEIDVTFDLTYNPDNHLWEWEPSGGETLPNTADQSGTGGIDDDDLDMECIATSSKGIQSEFYVITE